MTSTPVRGRKFMLRFARSAAPPVALLILRPRCEVLVRPECEVPGARRCELPKGELLKLPVAALLKNGRTAAAVIEGSLPLLLSPLP
jgi:hypothetical protein